MNPILTALRAIEARAERAIDHELQTMMQDSLALRTSLVLGERSDAVAEFLCRHRILCKISYEACGVDGFERASFSLSG